MKPEHRHVDWEKVLAVVTDRATAAIEAEERLDRLIFPLLSDEQLWWAIQQAQEILDDRYPMNSTELRCPECGHEDYFKVELYQWADLHRHGAEVDMDMNPDWSAECACVCRECDHADRLWRFMKAWRERHPQGE